METDIFNDNLFKVPINYKIKDGFSNSMSQKMTDYEALVRQRGYKEASEKIKKFSLCLGELYKFYNKGMHAEAYAHFKKAMEHLSFQKTKLFFKLEENEFYRARVNDGNVDFKQKEMMHIPLNMRGKVRTERYSAPGLPCLYLGASPYVCWVELNRPSFETFQVAKFKRKALTDVYILDLSILPNHYKNHFIQQIPIEEYLCMWPIIALCSIKVKKEKDEFKPEYIFPQFVLEYIMSEKISKAIIGIKYASMKVGQISKKQYKESPRTYVSYVIPTSSDVDDVEEFDSRIEQLFEITGTASGKELQLLTDVARSGGTEWEEFDNETKDKIKLHSSFGSVFEYDDSIFARIETALATEKKNRKGKRIFKKEVNDVIEVASKKDIDQLFE